MSELIEGQVNYNDVAEVGEISEASAKPESIRSVIVMMSAMQLGVDVLHELYDCGNIVTSLKSEELNMVGIRRLLAKTLSNNVK